MQRYVERNGKVDDARQTAIVEVASERPKAQHLTIDVIAYEAVTATLGCEIEHLGRDEVFGAQARA